MMAGGIFLGFDTHFSHLRVYVSSNTYEKLVLLHDDLSKLWIIRKDRGDSPQSHLYSRAVLGK